MIRKVICGFYLGRPRVSGGCRRLASAPLFASSNYILETSRLPARPPWEV